MKKFIYLFFACLIAINSQAQTWTKLTLPETGKAVKDIYEDSNGNLFALTAQGLFKSTDKAENWLLVDRNMEGNSILLRASNNDIWVTGDGIIKYNSTSSDQQDIDIVGNSSIMVELSDGKIISITKEGTTIWNSKNYLRISSDNGSTFNKKNNITNVFFKANVNAELFVNKKDDIFYLGTDKNLYKSTDKGQTFTAMGSVISYPNKSNGIYLDKEKEAFYAIWGSNNAKDLKKSLDDGATWTKLNSKKLYGVDKVIARNDIVVAYGLFSFLYSTDGGQTFIDKKTMFESGNFPEKIIITKDEKIFAINIKENAILELDIANETKTLKTKGLDYASASGLSFNGSRMAAILNGYAHYTDDYGTTWKQLKGDGAYAGKTYVAKNGKIYTASRKSGTWNGVFVQSDNDAMVALIADVKNVWNMQSMFEDDKGNIYCLSNLNGLYKSEDGMNFTQIPSAPFDNLNDMSMWFDKGLKRVYAIVSGDSYYSDDYAVTWTKGTAPAVTQNNFFRGNGGMWTFANNGTGEATGFYFSTDLTTWSGPKKPNISFDHRWDEPIQGNLGTLYRAHKDNAYQGGTVLKSTDAGLTWSHFVDGLDVVKGFGFNGGGKGVPYNEILASNDKLFLGTIGSIFMTNQENSLSIKDNNISSLNIKTYPNPVKDILNIKIDNHQIKEIEIYNLFGKKVFSKKGKIDTVNISQLVTGIYLLQLKLETKTITRKIIKR